MALKFLNDGYFAGKVGIGIETPTSTLHVAGPSTLATQGTVLKIENTADQGSAQDIHIYNQYDRDIGIKFETLGGTNYIWQDSNSDDSLILSSGGTNRTNDATLIINQSHNIFVPNGKVGIGATSADHLLTLQSSGDTILQINRKDDTIQGGNRTGIIQFGARGTWGTNLQTSKIWSYAEETFTSTANGTSLRFFTTELGATTPTENMIIDTDGKVGIGTTSPDYKLDIGGTTASVNNVARIMQNNGGTAIRIGSGGGSSDVVLLRIDGNSATNGHDGASNSSNYGFSFKYFGVGSGNDNRFGILSDNQLAATQVEAISILQDGNVGIGTTSPVNKQQNKYTSVAIASMTATSGTASTNWNRNAGLLIEDQNSSNGLALGVSGTANDRKSWIQSGHPSTAANSLGTISLNPLGGNVGIGTTSPGYSLDVESDNNILANFESTTNKGAIRVSDNDTVAYISAENGRIGFGTSAQLSASNLTMLTSNNYVGIGTHSPSEKLEVVGNVKITDALLSNQENTDIDSAAAEMVAQVAIATYTAAFFDFVVKKSTNVRSGTVYACHDGTNVEFTETSTQDLGDTSDVVLSVDISGGNMRLMATVASDDWSVKSLIRAI